jgi:ribose/xylose/arabinose/galactoside ABC-type transport system permease subunit
MEKKRYDFKSHWRENVLAYASLFLLILFSAIAPGFFSIVNMLTILRTMSIICVLGLGLTFVLTAGEIDISIGTLPAFTGCTLAVLLKYGAPLYMSLIIALAAGILIGLINGMSIVKFGVPSIIITLGTHMISNGAAFTISERRPVIVRNDLFLNIFGEGFLGFPKIVLWMILLVIVSYFLLHKTKFGRNLSFIGENRVAAHYSGIKVDKVLILSFLLCSAYSFFAGILGVARASSATPWMITPQMLTALAAPILGGTSLSGGKGKVFGTLVGAFFLTILSNGLLIYGIDPWVLYLINGVIIINAMAWKK